MPTNNRYYIPLRIIFPWNKIIGVGINLGVAYRLFRNLSQVRPVINTEGLPLATQ